MKQVTIIIPEEAIPAAIVDPQYMFTAVNQFLQNSGASPLFNVQLVGLTAVVKLNNGLFCVHPHATIDKVHQTDLVVIPALSGNMAESIRINQAYIPWIIEQHKQGAEVASLCVGSFLLAATGLVNGKKCSTHWLFAHQFRQLFPEVELVDGCIVTEEQGVYSSGGASSYWNLLLHLVEKYTSREMAIMAAKFFALEINRQSQAAFMIFNGQKEHDDEAIRMVQHVIEQTYSNRLSVDELAEKASMGRRSFERRFKRATGNTVIEYMQRVRIEAAKRNLETSRKNVNEVMFDVGYSDTKAFRDVFKKVTGLTPVEYRNKYNKQVA